MDAREVRTRVITSLIAGPVVLFMARLGGFYFLGIMSIIIGFSVWEFYRITENTLYKYITKAEN